MVGGWVVAGEGGGGESSTSLFVPCRQCWNLFFSTYHETETTPNPTSSPTKATSSNLIISSNGAVGPHPFSQQTELLSSPRRTPPPSLL